jgi:hypothetical protein
MIHMRLPMTRGYGPLQGEHGNKWGSAGFNQAGKIIPLLNCINKIKKTVDSP